MFIEDVVAFVNTRVGDFKKNYAAEFSKLSLEEQEILTQYVSYKITLLVEEHNSQCYKLLSFEDTASSEDAYTVDADERSISNIAFNSDKRISQALSLLIVSFIFFQDKVQTELGRLFEQLSVKLINSLMYQALDSISGDPVTDFWEQEQAGIPENLGADLNRLLHINYQLYMIGGRFNLMQFLIPAGQSRQYHMIDFERFVFAHPENNPFFSDLAEVQEAYAQSLDVVSEGLLDSVNPSLRESLEQLRQSRQELLAELISIRKRLEANPENEPVVLKMILAHAGFLRETIQAYSATSAPVDFPAEKARVFLGILDFEVSLLHTKLRLDDGRQYWLPAEYKRPSFIRAVTLSDRFNHPILQKIVHALFTPEELQQYITSGYRFLKISECATDLKTVLNEHLTNETVFKFAKYYIDNNLECSSEITELDKEYILMKITIEMMAEVLYLQKRFDETFRLKEEAELLTAKVHSLTSEGQIPSAVEEINLEGVIRSLRELADSFVLQRLATRVAAPISSVAVLGIFGGSAVVPDDAQDSAQTLGASLG